MWRFVGNQKGLEPIPGLPLEASDEDFEAAVQVYEAQFSDPAAIGSVKASGLYKHSNDRRREPAEEAATAAEEG